MENFSLQASLKWLLDRCPKLRDVCVFQSYANQGVREDEDEVVKKLAEAFLVPEFTAPVTGCFRPILREIVDKAVGLLRFVPNLRLNSDEAITAVDNDDWILVNDSVIEYYSRNGKGLDLHEYACLAFCRALDLTPFLLGSVISYFEFAPPPFQRVLTGQAISDPGVTVGRRLLSVVRTSYRLLLTASDTFTKLWDWSCFLDLIKQYKIPDSCSCTETLEIFSDIKWCGLKIVSVALRLSDRAIENLGVKLKGSEAEESEDALSCFLRWERFLQDVSLEKAGWYIESSRQNESASCNGSCDFDQKMFVQSFGFDCQHVASTQVRLEPPVRSQRHSWDCASSGNPFVLTSTVKTSFETVRLATSQKWPVLLYGPSGSGKSSLINKLAHNSGKQVVSIHMDDQMDGKTLIGSYVSTEQPGEFKWQLGSLSQAVLHGYWVVFEDIDKAPSDVHSITLPLLEGASSLVTGNGEEIQVAEGFRLFSTITASNLEVSSSTKGGSLSVFWRRVKVRSPKGGDLEDIVTASYPRLEPLAKRLRETFEKVNELDEVRYRNSDSVGQLSRFSLRDLLKWCKRVDSLGLSFIGNSLSADECHCICQEAVDIFAAFSPVDDTRKTIRNKIAELWHVPLTTVENLYTANKPLIQDSLAEIRIGRVTLEPLKHQTTFRSKRKSFVEIRSSLHLLERLAASVKYNEPVLMVGETGTGKTTLVQDLARRLGQKLIVLNLSQQSDVADLLGGFKPMDAKFICLPLYNEFEDLFQKTFSKKANSDFLLRLQKHFNDKKWKSLLSGFQKGVDFFWKSVDKGLAEPGKKRKKPLDEERIKSWENFAGNLETARHQVLASSGIIFSFVEGAFINALKNGYWILLDEVNLAPPETLQRVSGVLEGANGSLCLAERGDVNCIHRHPNFRLFACMNPATDAGKRDLPFSLRSRFTEYFVDDVLDHEDLTLFVNQFLGDKKSAKDLANKIVCFYKKAKESAKEKLQDGANQKPQYSLRSLYRALEYTRKAETTPGGSKVSQRAIYDGFCMFFQTLLDRPSAETMNKMILSFFLGGKIPPHVPFDDYLRANGVTKMQMELHGDEFTKNYILTRSVRENLRNVARAILITRYPVLLQGPTSSGKTSLVRYLATLTGNEFVRINNHEHTDLQEYLGTYITDASGKLVFHEGALVRAVRNGSWIVLDELNLAPSDVLEALNRLLDDNRELFVPELQQTIPANPDFMLFATQNPPTIYGGRKMLSRAFRNRFVEIHVDEIPEDELSTIIEKRCRIPGSYAKKMVDVMKELQLNRQRSKVFAGKHGYITPRDLFRWADRFRELGGSSTNDLARDGYFLLAERLREEGEKSVVREVLEKHLRVKLVENDLYNKNFSIGAGDTEGSQSVTWTKSMQRLYFLVERCHRAKEPVLLVGETGGGKTTVCQLLSSRLKLNLHILNCHQYTETSDFLGGFYPIRERSTLMSEFAEKIVGFKELVMLDPFNCCNPDANISSDIDQASSTLTVLREMIKKYKQELIPRTSVSHEDMIKKLQIIIDSLSELYQKWQTIFMWQDGPLVHAMKIGDLFLVDEISLADDSVIERLNSVLETERTLSLAEKGGPELEKITADEKFLLLATMNPGGDFGKKELSPALRNRFTEIWVPPVSDIDELRSIALQRLSSKLSGIVDPMLSFWEWFSCLWTGKVLTVRDLLSWVDFMNVTEEILGAKNAFCHGLFLVLLNGLSLGTGISKTEAGELRERCVSFILEQLKVDDANSAFSKLIVQNDGWVDLDTSGDVSSGDGMQFDNIFYPFDIEQGPLSASLDLKRSSHFKFLAPTTHRNARRVVRAMQLPKPVLLEGSPGVGKTSLIVALGRYFQHRVVRINLSEQTDMMDLLGSDLPVESDDGMKFAWSDGILLQALKEGSWVLLDELNLAPQSVLEGLNAILDHRAEVFIPELGRTFKCPPSFRIFACQNPTYQGGGRKGLPKSFLNRFAKVYVDELVDEDYISICASCFPSIPGNLLEKLISFNKKLYEDTMLYHKFAQEGSPWEFNLRDVIRSCEIITGAPDKTKEYCFLNLVYVQRMRTEADRRQVIHLYEQTFKVKPCINPSPRVQLDPRYLIVGSTSIERNYVQSSKVYSSDLKILPGIHQSLEAVVQCVRHQWLCILVGPASSGKTSLIRLLAELTGNVLNELHLSSGTDISEILGCFEQYNAIRNFRSIVAQMQCYIDEYCYSKKDFASEGIITKWFAFSSSINVDFLSCFTSHNEEAKKRFSDSLTLLKEIIGQFELFLEKNKTVVSWSDEERDRAKRTIDRAMRTIDKLLEGHKKGSFSAKFEWVAGLLVKAIERGEWIVLENANCCNPTVLDRINSLVEPSGSITVNECGIVDGKPVILQPHPNFRMFLTVNPSFGEVSRAMRNRGVEIFLMQPCWLPDESSGFKGDEFELKDANNFLVLSGIPIDSLVQAMSKAHVYVRKEGLHFGVSITYLELSRWVQLFQQFIMMGNQPIWSLQTSWEHIYLSSFAEADKGKTVTHAKDTYLSVTGLFGSCMLLSPSLCLPGGWPNPLKLRDFALSSRECTVKQNCMYVNFLAAQCASYKLKVKWCNIQQNSAAIDDIEPSLMDAKMLCQYMFPGDLGLPTSNFSDNFDFEVAKEKLLFAADWTIEQAPEADLRLYLLWFSKVSPKFQLLAQFSNLVEKIMEHPIWKDVSRRFNELLEKLDDSKKFSIAILSVELVDEIFMDDERKKFLCNVINCVRPLKLTYKQWGDEWEHNDNLEEVRFKDMLRSLQMLEDDFLKKLVDPHYNLVESQSFDAIIETYESILEDHKLFWNGVKKKLINVKKTKNPKEDLGQMLIPWRSLLKNAAKLEHNCPEAVHHLLEESKNLEKAFSWRLHSEKSLLWAYGGRPVLPSSAGLFHKQIQLLNFCELLWPTKTKSIMCRKKKAESEKPGDYMIEIVAAFNSKLRILAVEGISKLPVSSSEADVDQQLGEIYEELKECFELTKLNCKKILSHNKLEVLEKHSSAFCSYPIEILCHKSGFDSWHDTLPLIDITSFYLDMELLQDLSCALLVDSGKLNLELTTIAKHLEATLNFSLVCSSRPPQMFSPHRKLLWILDAWTLVDAVNAKVASLVLEMWFRWHQSLWIYHAVSVQDSSKICQEDSVSKLEGDCYDIPVPDMLVHSVIMNTVNKIVQSPTPVRDYLEGSLKLKVASCNLWRCLSPGSKLPGFLSSAVRCLFGQIINAHKKAFEADKFKDMESFVRKLSTNMIEKESFNRKLEEIKSDILSSSHQGLRTSVDIIESLLRELHHDCSSTDCISNVGRAWLHLGVLRLNLLLSCDDLDPVMKHHYRNSQLADKISSLKLEIQVRQECNYLAGRLTTREDGKKEALQNLEVKRRKLQRKIVFRSDYGKFKNLKHECNEFLKRVKFLRTDIKAMDKKICDDWQKTATRFIEQLSVSYPEYMDFVQPVQVAIYELKLGFSLLSRVEKNKMDVESIYTFMRFPSTSPAKTKSIKLKSEQPGFPPYELEIYTDFWAEDVDISHTLDILYKNQPEVSRSQLKAYLHQNILFRTTHSVSNSHIMDSAFFKILHESFVIFADFWKNMKENQVNMREGDSQQYKFRTRAFKIENVIELDISTLGKSLANESFQEWRELVAEDEQREDACKEQDNSEEEWNLIDESILNSVVRIHDQLFGLNSFITSGAFQISDEDRFISFIGSYTFGTTIVRGLEGSFLSNLDARLAPEHLLRLCLEHDQKFVSSHKSARRYNFYKDSNALEMSKMAKLLYPLEQRVCSLVHEWEYDHTPQKILSVIEMLLNIPLSTPLAKVLSGLQFLVNNIRILKENGTKFPISDQLDTILHLVVSWQKLEFESWPVLLDEVQHQYDINAEKLWFPLYPILLGKSWSGVSTNIQSFEDFMQSSSIGEFRRRLELLFAFLGQIYTGHSLKFDPRWFEKETMDMFCYEEEKMKILFNVIGFYVQFLPRILEHIEASRKNVEKELKELLKLCSWERPESSLSIENSKRTRQKFKKLIQKYNDLLQQPAMLFLNQDAELKKTIESDDRQKFLNDYTERNARVVDASSGQSMPDDRDRFGWYAEWRKKADGAIRGLKLNKVPNLNVLRSLSEGIIRQCSSSQSARLSYKDEWNAVWFKLESIFRTVVDCGDLWKEENKSQQKRRALSELLKLLESSGLSRHKHVDLVDQVKSWWFLEPSHELQHLMPTVSLSKSESLPDKHVVTEWKAATECYFRSVASVLLLRQICLNSHKDITLEQVERSGSFLYQLIEIQKKQHAAAVVFAENLKCFKERISILKNLHLNYTSSDDGTRCSMFDIVRNEDAIFKCMWQQKQLFDSLYSISHDELLLLRTFEHSHSETCENVKASSQGILASIEKFFPIFKNSKELLDDILLGRYRDITKVPASPYLFVVSREMEALVSHNFQIIEDFKKHLDGLNNEDADRSLVKETLLGHFKEVFEKKKSLEDEFISETLVKNVSLRTSDMGISGKGSSKLDDEFLPALQRTFEHSKQAMKILCSSPNEQSLHDELVGNITSWHVIFDSLVKKLSLEHLCSELLELISRAKELFKDSRNEFQSPPVQIGAHFENLLAFLYMLSNFGDRLLQENLDMHKATSMMIRVLADVLASLYSRGFGVSTEDQVSNGTRDAPQDASGTGMGEGVGAKDVSDQIADEDQLLGASNKLEEEQDASGEGPNKHDKGIEMDQDFDADTYDVSEDSEEDMDEDGEDVQLESAMGETGADNEAVNEKLWNKDEDEGPNEATEKYEAGPSIKDTDASSRELRAKDDSALTADEPAEFNNPQEGDKSDGETGEQDDVCEDGENKEDVNLDKEDAFTDSTGLQPNDGEQSFEEDMDLDKEGGTDSVEEASVEAQDEAADYRNSEEENPCPDDETMEEAETGQLDATSDGDELGGDHEQNAQTDLTKREMLGSGMSDSFGGDSMPNSESSTQLKSDLQASDLSNMAPEMNWSNSNDTRSGLAPLRGLPSSNTSEQDRMVSESMTGGRNGSDQPQTPLPRHDSSSSVQKNEANPYRSHGDPLKEWKERVNIGVDLEAEDTDAQGDIQDENADEFGYVSEFEKGTSQALGPATAEQADGNVNRNKTDENELTTDRDDDIAEMEIDKETPEMHPLKNGASVLKSKLEDKIPVPHVDKIPREESKEIQGHGDEAVEGLSDGIVSISKSYFGEGVNQLGKLSINDSELGKVLDLEDISAEALNNSIALWRRYELSTTRLSQELAEQLRLVLEPTVASKLQGDYKTGKRINMKKVIPYIASHFRRDKIWLRRTRPNKRDYQVVIAVDDSSSMSENCCGNFAIEALVAVCRAMSQLEMGNLAVTSFGKMGNIRLLHDFDQPFTAEAGIKMISSFTFKQENVTGAKPYRELLLYLNNKLDEAVAKARLPSGQNPLEQLVLIIGDGRLHEKDLKPLVRDLMSRKRMVAFLILDSSKESILDQLEVHQDCKIFKYLDFFPFPFYIVLRNIEALPRTLADLLRQWFELMQSSRD